eukprot:TRINITY_DN55688_c0_g1_i2.p1 TRINITY_DN55688_c0_g1~~TRINITY_DN55688_c0_g1_i2.p1  ORF type:complete len:224 (-),score=50.71 TRINITY_DN55688_c0_g1_i2:4-675(-)
MCIRDSSWTDLTARQWTDPGFGPGLHSLVGQEAAGTWLHSASLLSYHQVEWVRASEHFGSAPLLGRAAILAGPLGDPFFNATLPEDGGQAAFGQGSVVSRRGVYEVRINSPTLGQHTVRIDDWVPILAGAPAFCSFPGTISMTWPLLYMKACAKLVGGYANLFVHIRTVPEQLTLAAPFSGITPRTVSYTHLRAHETPEHLVCRLLLEKKKNIIGEEEIENTG